jgi:hypothetical protein
MTSLIACEACAGVGELVLTGRIGLKPRTPSADLSNFFSSSLIITFHPTTHFSIKSQLGMEAPSARRRQIRACQRCRTLKVRCDTQRPICARCAKAGVQCAFLPDAVASEGGIVDQRVARNPPQEMPTVVRSPMAWKMRLTIV